MSFLNDLQHKSDTRELQVKVANKIHEFDRNNVSNSVTRSKVEELLFEISHKFLVNKNFNVQSHQFKLIRELNSDPDYQCYVLVSLVFGYILLWNVDAFACYVLLFCFYYCLSSSHTDFLILYVCVE